LSPGSLPGFAGSFSVVTNRGEIRRTLDNPHPRQLVSRTKRVQALADFALHVTKIDAVSRIELEFAAMSPLTLP